MISQPSWTIQSVATNSLSNSSSHTQSSMTQFPSFTAHSVTTNKFTSQFHNNPQFHTIQFDNNPQIRNPRFHQPVLQSTVSFPAENRARGPSLRGPERTDGQPCSHTHTHMSFLALRIIHLPHTRHDRNRERDSRFLLSAKTQTKLPTTTPRTKDI